MTCPKCHSENVTIQVVTESKLKTAHHGLLWWLIIGWWWLIVKWLFLTIPALLAKIFIPRKQRIQQKQIKTCVCQNCGHTWEA